MTQVGNDQSGEIPDERCWDCVGKCSIKNKEGKEGPAEERGLLGSVDLRLASVKGLVIPSNEKEYVGPATSLESINWFVKLVYVNERHVPCKKSSI